jgi:outer membrane murein-binding lipoprotein Lpp
VRLLLAVIALVALAGCKSTPKADQLPAAVPAPKAPDLSAVGSTLDVIDSRVAAAVTVAREANTAGKPAVVESELSVAGSFLPKPTEGDLAYARQRSEKATPADYERQRAKAAEKQKAAEQAWMNLEAQVAASKAALAARDKRIEELTAEIDRIKKDAMSQTWTLVGAGLAVIGALTTAFMGPRIGIPLLLCGAFCGAVPHIIDSPYFEYIAGGTLLICSGLGLWWLADKVRDSVNKPSDDVPPQA